MTYRLNQCRTNYDFPRSPAGDFYIEQEIAGRWKRLDGFWPPYHRELAKARLKELEDAELPKIFEAAECRQRETP